VSLLTTAGYDPAAAGGLVAWQRAGGPGVLRRTEGDSILPGTHPALGAGRIAWREGGQIVVAEAASLTPAQRFDAPGAEVLAVGDGLVAWRAHDGETDRLWVRGLAAESVPVAVVAAAAGDQLGRPVLAGRTLVWHVAGPRGSRILARDLAGGDDVVLRREAGAQLTNPAVDGGRLLYVRATGIRQELRLGPLAPAPPRRDAVLLVRPSPGQRDREREPGGHPHNRRALPPRARRGVTETLWSTALAGPFAYVTSQRSRTGRPRTADILEAPAE